MKKKSLILLSSLFLLAGCTTTPTTSSSSVRPTSSSSSVTSSNCTLPLTSSSSSSTSTSLSTSNSTSSSSTSTSSSSTTTTSSSSTASVDQSLVAKKEEVSNYIAALNYDAYREAEQETLRTLVSSMQGVLNDSNDVDEIDAVFSAFKTQVSELKTKAQYEQEEAEELAKQLEQKKQEVLAKIEISSPTQYRSKEINELLAIQDTLKNQINAATSIEALEAIDLSSLSNAIATAKTNAMYTMEEILPFGEDAGWDLVNAHRNQMVLNEDKTITTKDDGYALDSTKYSGDMEVVFSVNADTYQSLSGLLFATKTSVSDGDGLDGFTLNIARGAGFEYIQVYHIDNFYGATSDALGSYEYIGGWVFTDDYPGEKVVNTELRAKISGTTLKIFKEADYQKYGENAKVCAVDLSFGGKYTVATERQLGIITWGNNGVPFTLKLSMLAGSTYIDGKEHAIELATNYFAKVDTAKYDTETANSINAKKASILGLAEDMDATYEDIISAINELKVMVKEADDYLANGAKIRATALMDAIFSTDNSTMSSWDAVVDHTMNQWTHEKGTNSVTTPTTVSAGWQLSKDRYSDIDLTFKIDGAQKANPYTGINSKSVLIGAESLGMYPKGYAVTVFQMETEAWVQVHYINNNINANFVCGVCEWVDGQSIRVVIEGKTLSIYINGIKRDITIQDFSTRSEVELLDYNGGSIGILNWDDAQIQTTFTFEEFTGTKI